MKFLEKIREVEKRAELLFADNDLGTEAVDKIRYDINGLIGSIAVQEVEDMPIEELPADIQIMLQMLDMILTEMEQP